MAQRVWNFSPGPAAMPEPVLQRAQAELLDWQGTGMSVMEMSHRGPEFMAFYAETEAKLRDVRRFGVIYAGAQKNMGPAGVTLVLVRDDLIDRARPECPTVFNYGVQAKSDSMANTPPTFAIYLAGLTIEWLIAQGGLAAIERANIAKAALLYGEIERTGFYRNPVQREDRSRMNVPFHVPDARLDAPFLSG